MLYYVYIWVLDTDIVVMQRRVAERASKALDGLRRKLRRAGEIEKGTRYRACIFNSLHDSSHPDWNSFEWSEVKTAR